MAKFELSGYMTDGRGGQRRAALDLGFNLHLEGEALDFSLRLSEAGKKIGHGREMGITLTPAQWREVIAAMEKEMAVAEEILAELKGKDHGATSSPVRRKTFG